MNKILIAPSTFGELNPAPLRRLTDRGFEVVRNPYGRKLTKDELIPLLEGAVGIVAGLEPLSHDVLERCSLKVISRCGSGLSNVDVSAARKLGIEVRSTPDAPVNAVAELTVGCMIVLLRQVPLMNRELHRGRWTKKIGQQVGGKTVLIVGMGRIGRKVAELLRPFDVRLIATDPQQPQVYDGIRLLPLEEALPISDVVTLHASGDDEILGADAFANVKSGVYILNAARGGLINESALCEALDNGTVTGAWLDTFGEEPYQGPLLRYDNVILTPHIGSASVQCRQDMEAEAVDNLLAAF